MTNSYTNFLSFGLFHNIIYSLITKHFNQQKTPNDTHIFSSMLVHSPDGHLQTSLFGFYLAVVNVLLHVITSNFKNAAELLRLLQ